MRQRYPAANIQDSVLYVHDGPISTSAGFSTGIDLAISIVERDCGPATTAAVARNLVIYLRRSGSTGQLSPFLRDRDHLNPAVHRVQDHVAQHLDAPHPLARLAALVNLSVRGLTRAFTTTIGMTPLEYQQGLRLELASVRPSFRLGASGAPWTASLASTCRADIPGCPCRNGDSTARRSAN